MKYFFHSRFLLSALSVLLIINTYAQPKISAFSPASGPVGTTVTITGSGFDGNVAGNTVLFGSIKAPVTSASATMLKVTVPAGTSYQAFSVLNNTNGLTGYSYNQFITTFNNTSGGGVSAAYFQPRIDFSSTVAHPGALTFSDIDGDGKLDLSYLDVPSRLSDPNSLNYQRNESTPGTITSGSFGARVSISAGMINSGIFPADMDGDGKTDLLIQLSLGSRVAPFRNTSTPGALTTTSFSGGGEIPSTALGNVGDIDGDGRPDILALPGDGTVAILRNLSTPGNLNQTTFAAAVKFPVTNSPGSIAVTDLDGDGRPEIVSVGTTAVTVLRNTATPGSISASSFAPEVNIGISTGTLNINSFSVGDIDNDGKPDLVAGMTFFNGDTGKIAVLRNNTTPGIITAASFGPQVNFSAGIAFGSVTLGDIDGNGAVDLLYFNRISAVNSINTISILLNTAAGGTITSSSFAPAVSFQVAGVGSIRVLDVDADGKPELVITNDGTYTAGSTYFSILKIREQALTVPVITGVNPGTAPAGASVTISGSGFNTTLSSNIVFFGAVKGTVTAASANSLTVTVPAGASYSPVSVLNLSSGTAYSPRPFIESFSNPFGNGVPLNFYPSRYFFPTGKLTYSAALGDLDGDGKPDLVTANFSSNTVSVFFNTSDAGTTTAPSFAGQFDLATGTNPYTVLISDVDGDGKPEIIVGNYGAGTISIFHNETLAPGGLAAFQFSTRVNINTGGSGYPFSMALGDLDGDGKPDLVTANSVANTVSVIHNTSNPPNSLGVASITFDAAVSFATGEFPRSVAISDINGDGKPDIVTANQNAGTVSILKNTAVTGIISAGSFAPKTDYAAGDRPISVAIGDLNGDNKPDLAVANNIPYSNVNSPTVTVLANTSDAGIVSFAAGENLISYGKEPFSIAIGDVTGDGLPDILTANAVSVSFSVLRHLQNVGGTSIKPMYATAVEFATSGYPVFVTSGDINGDGRAETVVVNAPGSFSVFKIGTPSPPVISSFSPGSGPAGTLVALNGANFDLDNANNIVYFGAVKATVTGSGGFSNLASVIVPPGATDEPISLLNVNSGLTGYAYRSFITTFSTPFGATMPANFYRPKVDYPTGALPYAAVIADLNGDGKPDLVTANFNSGTISILTNTAATGSLDATSFSTRADIPVGGQPYAIAVKDLDGDGKPDILVANYASSTISVLKNISASIIVDGSSFAPKVDFAVGTSTYPFSLTTADLDGDGRPEIIAANSLGNTVSVLRNTATTGSITASSFAPKVDFRTGIFPRSVVARDLDGDGKPELVVANMQSGSISVLRNTSAAGVIDISSFAAKVDFVTGIDPIAVVVGDAEGDGKADIVVANHGSNTVSVLRNMSTTGMITASSFAPKVDFATGPEPFSVAISDVNGDGRPDLVTPDAVANTVSVLRNTSVQGSINGSSFAGKADYGTGGYPVWVAPGDLDGDGKAEITTANASGSVSVLKINTSASLSPSSVLSTSVGTDKTISGLTKMQVYPNPSTGLFTVSLPNPTVPVLAVEVFNETGKTVQKRTISFNSKAAIIMQLNLSGQPAGVYHVKVTSVGGVQVMNVVLQR